MMSKILVSSLWLTSFSLWILVRPFGSSMRSQDYRFHINKISFIVHMHVGVSPPELGIGVGLCACAEGAGKSCFYFYRMSIGITKECWRSCACDCI